jgi:hypothetical protein
MVSIEPCRKSYEKYRELNKTNFSLKIMILYIDLNIEYIVRVIIDGLMKLI